MLRIHFTVEDMARIRVAKAADPLWETALSLQRLTEPLSAPLFDCWRRRTRTELAAAMPAGSSTLLRTVMPLPGQVPTLLTPADGPRSWEAGVDAVLSAPHQQLRDHMLALAGDRPPPSWMRPLAEGDVDTLDRLAEALRTYHEIAMTPVLTKLHSQHSAELGALGQALAAQGIEGVFATLGPCIRWTAPVLEVDFQGNRDLHLDGRGLLLVPSVFYRGTPLISHSAEQAPALVYSVPHARAPRPAPAAPAEPQPDQHAALLRWAREHLADDLTVSDMARHAGLSHRTLIRRFKATTLLTPQQWLAQERIALAQQLLESTDLSIDRIAQRCGLGTATNLRARFHRHLGVTPTAYRRDSTVETDQS